MINDECHGRGYADLEEEKEGERERKRERTKGSEKKRRANIV
jgi:hypothetical protein